MPLSDVQHNYNTMIIDDDPVTLMLLERILKNRGHFVHKFSNAEEALKVYGQTRFPLIITDFYMDGMTGEQFCSRIRSMPNGDLAVILLITAMETADQLQSVIDAGADDYLTKPIERNLMNIRLTIAENLVVNKIHRKEALEELSNNRAQYKRIFDESPLAMVIHDGKKLLHFNQSALSLFGVRNYSDLEFARIDDLWAKDFLALFYKRVEQMKKTKKSVPLVEEKIRHSSGELRDILIKGMPIDFDGRQAFQSIAIDITEKKKIEERLNILSSSLEQSSIAVVLTDIEGNIEYVNPKFTQNTGYTSDEVLGKNPRILKSGIHSIELYDELWSTIKHGGEWRGELCNKTKSGEFLWEYVSISPIRDNTGKIIRFLAAREDISQLKRNEEALRESEERYKLVSMGASDGLWDWKIDEDVVYFSPRWKQTLGFSEDELNDTMQDWINRIHPDDLDMFQGDLSDHLRGFVDQFVNESRVLHKDSNYRWILTRGIALRHEDGHAYRIAGSITDVSVRKKAEQKIIHDAFYDSLTNLPNMKLFIDRLSSVIARAKRHENYFIAVLFIDVDRLKVINDSLGHRRGDIVIKEISERLVSCVRSGDTVARISGDSFVAMLDDLNDFSDAVYIVKRMQKKVNEPILVEGHEVVITISIGISVNSIKEESAEDLVRFANIAMSKVKSQGRNNFRRYQHEMSEEAQGRLEIEHRLYHAIANNELLLHFQPQVDIVGKDLMGFEALLRWNSKDLGMVSPGQFIPIAEETGLITQMGDWVLQEACRQIKVWQQKFQKPIVVAVNFSARQFQQDDLVENIQKVISESSLNPESLEVEITESIVMDNMESTVGKLKRLKDLGMKVSIDDFGTGYSSLSYLRQLPLDRLKIDQSFIRGIPEDSNSIAITHAIIGLARNLGLDLIAEGVETMDQMKFLHDNSCHKIQGYLFSRPLSDQDTEKILMDKDFPSKIINGSL